MGPAVPRHPHLTRTARPERRDPFTLVVAPNSNGSAEGNLNLDPGDGFEYRGGAYALRSYSLADGVLTSAAIHASPLYASPHRLERVEILGIKTPAKARTRPGGAPGRGWGACGRGSPRGETSQFHGASASPGPPLEIGSRLVEICRDWLVGTPAPPPSGLPHARWCHARTRGVVERGDAPVRRAQARRPDGRRLDHRSALSHALSHWDIVLRGVTGPLPCGESLGHFLAVSHWDIALR